MAQGRNSAFLHALYLNTTVLYRSNTKAVQICLQCSIASNSTPFFLQDIAAYRAKSKSDAGKKGPGRPAGSKKKAEPEEEEEDEEEEEEEEEEDEDEE